MPDQRDRPDQPDSPGPPGTPGHRVPCAGAVVRDDGGRLLLVRRANAPAAGRWSVPGGRVEPGETAADAAVREVAEETGLTVLLDGVAGVVERQAPGGGVFVITDFWARPVGDPAAARAGDDASELRWVSPGELDALDRAGLLVDGLAAALRDWGAG